MKKLILFPAILLGAAPLAFIVTFLFCPFWGLLESVTGIESLGHSGPAAWCFYTVYGLIVLASLAMWLFLRCKYPKNRLGREKAQIAQNELL